MKLFFYVSTSLLAAWVCSQYPGLFPLILKWGNVLSAGMFLEERRRA